MAQRQEKKVILVTARPRNQSVTYRLETSRYWDFFHYFESLNNLGLKKSLCISLKNFGLKKSLSNDLKKFVLKKVVVLVSKTLDLVMVS